ncbi:MAG TPA: hypothetical protein VHN19_01370 [Burkholderiales bacterium]|nr:hypothetical protein [Burkholderiales bacterium]
MKARRTESGRSKQQGFALILMVMVFIIGVTWYGLGALGKAAMQGYERDRVTAAALKQAKEALLAYLVTTAAMTTDTVDSRQANPGRLPCPESLSHPGTVNEGKAADLLPGYTCGAVGRLPWKSLGVDQIRDGYGEPLWYAVPLGTWAKTTTATALTINPGLANQMTYDGTASAVVAVIIAPGAGLNTTGEPGTPSGTCSGFAKVNQLISTRNAVPLIAANFLECGDATGANYTTIGTSPWSNDRTISITAAEVMDAIAGAVADRMQRQVAPALEEWRSTQSLANWGASFLPYASTFTQPASNDLCGNSGVVEGTIPVVSAVGSTCTAWGGGNVSGLLGSLLFLGCAQSGSNYQCFFFNTGFGALTTRVTATVSNVSGAFRAPITSASVTNDSGGTNSNFSLTFSPVTGSATLSVDLSFGLLGFLSLVTVTIPDLGNAAMLSDSRMTWFTGNDWSRYAYYTIAPGAKAGAASACSGSGDPDCLTVSGLPVANGNTDDKRFVLTLMGRAVGSQAQPSASVTDYLESHAQGTTSFTSSVVTSAYNDRQATCPFKVTFTDSTTSVLCN